MLIALLAALPLQGPPQDPTERFQRRVTPEVEVVQATRPAVVFIQTNGSQAIRNPYGWLIGEKRFSGMGSGVVVRKQGFVITNYHVVQNAQSISVSFAQDLPEQDVQTYRAELVSFVPEEDLALLKIVTNDPKQEFPTIPLGTSADLMIGERVIAIGNPYGQTHTVSAGMISGLHRNVPIPQAGLEFDDLIQTDAAINQGNSGGPLLNINGELIGINSSMNSQAQNIGFAIPVDRVKSVLQSRLLSPEAARTWLGFEVENLQVSKIVPGSPAYERGLRTGDCIVAVNGQKVANAEDYRLARIGLPRAAEVELKFERAGTPRTIKLTPWDATDGMLFQRLGVLCQELRIGRERAVQLMEVAPNGPAAELGLQTNDIFSAIAVQVGRRPPAYRIRSKDDLAELLTQYAPPGTQLEVEIFRDLDRNNVLERSELHRGTLTAR
jgi:serine protease Do